MAIDLSVLDEEDSVESISPQGVGIDLSILDEELSPSSDDTISPIDLSVLDEDTSEPDLSLEPFPEQKDRRLRMFDEGLEFVRDVDNIGGDLGNQINRGLTNIAGMPVDAIGAVINKAASVFFPTTEEMNAARQEQGITQKPEDTTIGRFNEFMRDAAQEYLPSEGAAKKIRDLLNLIPGVNIVEEDPRTIAGYVGQVGSEFIAGLAPQVRAMQIMRASKPASYTGKALKEVSEQFLNELNTNAGRVLAIEAGTAVPAGVARGMLEDTDLPVGAKMLAEVISGLVGGATTHKLYGLPKSLVEKTAGKTATDIRDMIASGEITYDELTWTPTLRKEAKQVARTAVDDQPDVGIDPVMRSEIEGVPDPKNAQQTQVGNTIETVVRAGGILDNLAEGKTLDFGAGKGKGAGAIKADTYEPFAKAPFTPNYAKSTDIPNESYEKIISSSVINVVPRDIRDDIVREIGRVLKPNGYAIITARDPKTVASPKGAVPFAGESDAYIIKSKGRADTYQKGFTNQELQGYIKEVLGDDFDVKLTPKGLDGKKISGSSVIIQKKPGSAPIPKPVPRMPGIVEDSMKLQIARNQNAEALKTQAMANAVEIFYDFEGGRVAPRKSPKRLLDKVVKVLAPSKVVGRSIVNDIEMARGTVARAEELAARVQRGYNRLVKKDPSVANDLNDFLLKGGRMSKSLEPIETELLQYRGTILQLQKQLLEGLDAEEFLNLSKGAQNQLKEIIEASMEMGYLTQTYRMFLDPDFRPTKAQKDAAIAEIASKKLAAGETDIPEEATRMATEYIDDIVRSSAYQRKADGKKQLDISNVVKESKGILASRTDPGPAERIFLGEVTDPGERLISTASRLSRLASAKAEDVSIAKFLIDSGVATRNQVDPTQVEVKFRTTDADSNVWVSPDVNYAVNILRFNDGLTGSREIVNNFLLRLYSGATGFSKQTKVLFNPESYSVNGYGALFGAFSAGVVPTPTGIARGVNRALGDFGGLDNILRRKDPVARKRFLDDLDKMNQYGLKPKSVSIADLERNILDGFGKLNKLSKISKPKEFFLKISDFFGKLYSTSDTALRYVVWKGNQDNLSKMFPNASKAQIEAAAARLTNDTFPNYDKLSGLVRTFSRLGLAGQFVPFAAELTRNFYNQGKYAMKMMTGTFGRDIGLDPASAQKTYMSLQGVKRGGLLAAVTVGGDALTDSQNALRGVDREDSKEFSETIAAPWDKEKKLIVIPDETGRKGRYINPEYLIPQAIFKQAFDAGFSDKPIESLYDIAYDQYIGELGTFPVRTAGRLVFGRDEKGEPIYIDERFSENFKVGLGLAYDELLKPGGQRTYKRFMDTAAGIGQRTQVNNALRLAGFRDNTWDADIAFSDKVRDINEPMRKAKQNYYGMLRRVENNYESPDKLEAEYQRNNEARKSKMDALRGHYENMAGGTLKYSVGERIELMREAGMSSSDILDIVEGTYTDIPRTRSKSIGDQYEELEGSPSQKLDQIRSITKEDRNLGGKLADYHKRQMKLARSPGRSELDKLRSSLPEERRVQYMIDQGAHLNRAKLRELREAGIATPSAIRAMLLQTK